MLLAGTDTTANALVVGTYGILGNPKILERLNHELKDAFPDLESMASTRLRTLPYLVRAPHAPSLPPLNFVS